MIGLEPGEALGTVGRPDPGVGLIVRGVVGVAGAAVGRGGDRLGRRAGPGDLASVVAWVLPDREGADVPAGLTLAEGGTTVRFVSGLSGDRLQEQERVARSVTMRIAAMMASAATPVDVADEVALPVMAQAEREGPVAELDGLVRLGLEARRSRRASAAIGASATIGGLAASPGTSAWNARKSAGPAGGLVGSRSGVS